MEFVRGLVNT